MCQSSTLLYYEYQFVVQGSQLCRLPSLLNYCCQNCHDEQISYVLSIYKMNRLNWYGSYDLHVFFSYPLLVQHMVYFCKHPLSKSRYRSPTLRYRLIFSWFYAGALLLDLLHRSQKWSTCTSHICHIQCTHLFLCLS